MASRIPEREEGNRIRTQSYTDAEKPSEPLCNGDLAADILAAQMVATPWGDAQELGSRRLRPGPGTPREKVDRNQRERLFAAMVAVGSVKGYADTTIADLLEVSAVSRSSFYRHFAGKRECFLATVEEILSAALAVTASRTRSDGSWDERAEHSLQSFLELVVAQPAAARLCLVESYAAGPEGVARIDEAMAGFQALAERVLEERPEYRGMPEEMTWAMVGGLRKVIHTHLHRGTEKELPAAGPALVKLGLSYRPPPRPLRRAGRRRAETASNSSNGDAPAGRTATTTPDGDPGERIVRATMTTVAARGFAATKVADIAEAARVSLSTFYDHFDDKAAAFDAALHAGRARMLGYGVPIYRRARHWPEGVRAMIEAYLSHLAGEPEFAKLICVDVYAAGPQALERRDRAIESARRFIDDGVDAYAPGMPAIAREAIVNGLYAMLCNRVQGGEVDTLPEMAPLATYMALTPFLGSTAASEVASGGRADVRRV
jgi:AcrR family transcriptional regulator